MTNYLLTMTAALFATGQSTLTKLAPKEKGVAHTMLFNTVKVGAGFLLFLLISLHSLSFHLNTLLFASVYGVALFFSTHFGYLALASGPLAITSTVVSYSVLIPCLFGVIFLGEEINEIKLLGFSLLIISLLLLQKPSKDISFNKRWLMYVIITFLCNGIFSTVQKLHQTIYPSAYCSEFTTYSLLVCFALFLTTSIIRGKGKRIKKESVKFAAPAGILMGLNGYLTLTLSSQANASVLFPTLSVFQALFNLIFSRIIFKEKLSVIQILGIVTGVASVLLIK